MDSYITLIVLLLLPKSLEKYRNLDLIGVLIHVVGVFFLLLFIIFFFLLLFLFASIRFPTLLLDLGRVCS